MLTSKERAYLRGLANGYEIVVHIGKSGVTPSLTENVNLALEKRELIKIGILNNCEEEPKGMANILKERTNSEIVQIIGKKIILYRAAKKPKIELPK